jgi:hypothetical protein
VSTIAAPPGFTWGRLLPHAGYGRCFRCQRPWWACTARVVRYSAHAGQFVLCEGCWDRSAANERVAAHRWLTSQWTGESPDVWPDIEAVIRTYDEENT